MIEELVRLVDEITALNSKPILLIGPPGSGKAALLNALAKSRYVVPLNIGLALGRRFFRSSDNLRAGGFLCELA